MSTINHARNIYKMVENIYQMMLGLQSQKIPSAIAGKIQNHPEVQDHLQDVLPKQRKDSR